MRTILIVCLILAASAVRASDKDSVAVASSVKAFVKAFNNFDWPTFRAAFDKDATMFHPTWDHARRVRGTQQVEEAWLDIFPEFSDPNNKEKLSIDPKNINIQIYGSTAVVTFHLGDGVESLSRRTVVMVNKDGAWKIVHIHASRVEKGK
ncbi:MAG: nuclear transport factor 2 family protein [Chryseolinea sp.]